MNKKILLPVLILAFGVGGFVLLKFLSPPAQPVVAQEQIWSVKLLNVTLRAQQPTLLLYGRVESPKAATLRVPTLSQNNALSVLAVPHLEGEIVENGALLVKLEDRDTQLLLQQREAAVNNLDAQINSEKTQHDSNLAALKYEQTLVALAERGVARARQLEKQRAGSQAALDEASKALAQQQLSVTARQREIRNHPARLQQLQASLQQAKAQLAQVKLELSRTEIRAPFAGRLAAVSVAVGDRVQIGSILVSIYDTQTLEVRAQIPGRYQDRVLTALHHDQSLIAQTQLYNEPIQFKLVRVAGEIQQNSGGIDALLSVTQGAELLRLGQFVTPVLQLPQQENVMTLPYSAIYGADRIYKLVDGRMHSVKIELVGEQIDAAGTTHVLVRSAQLNQGDQIISTQLPNAMEGLRVQEPSDPLPQT